MAVPLCYGKGVWVIYNYLYRIDILSHYILFVKKNIEKQNKICYHLEKHRGD